MGRQGKLPLDSEKGRLNLSVEAENEGDGAVEPQYAVEQEITDEVETEAVEVLPAPEELPQDKKAEAEFISAEEMGSMQEEENLTLGDYLRNERMRRDLTLHEAAEQLRLRPKQIEALESGNYENLPGHAFVTGFLRSYANLLQLDAVSVVDLYKSESQGGHQAPELTFPEPTSEGKIPGMGLILGSMVLIAGLFAGWYFYLSENQLDLEIVSNLPAELQEKVGALSDANREAEAPEAAEVQETQAVASESNTAVQPQLASPTSVDSSKSVDVLASTSDEPNETASRTDQVVTDIAKAEVTPPKVPETVAEKDVTIAASSEPVSETEKSEAAVVQPSNEPQKPDVTEAAQQAVVTPEVQAPAVAEVPYEQNKLDLDRIETNSAVAERTERLPEALGVENADGRIVIVANQEAWVQVTGLDQAVVLDRVLEAGDTFMLPNQTGLTLSTANAGGVEIRVDGENLGSLGSYGHIVQSMPLVAEELKEKLTTVQ
ncbi:DUF4115 domain-containing protein [Sneathiella sp. P13V-1]|uniref:helix-turn-helix domain-containing protein n=1 Tax=Sneathiella sp. P13V-1 TaxID=2697366 RepID=UPI00187BADF6|nr:helix-turn-helix domain-containing protein [Sneathiella sp. P13V-1]MBE7636568.1 DUF4115 domain-containing protein [Sneathiella sp. P13V-1]